MTREALKKHWDVIKAYKNGAEVEFYHKIREEWVEIDSPGFYLNIEYRIKPKTEYVPFDVSDAKFLVGKVVKNQDQFSPKVELITGCDKVWISLGSTGVKYKTLFDDFTFLDGSPCGKLKE